MIDDEDEAERRRAFDEARVQMARDAIGRQIDTAGGAASGWLTSFRRTATTPGSGRTILIVAAICFIGLALFAAGNALFASTPAT